MKALAAKREQYLTDAKGTRTGVVLDLRTYEQLLEAEEELADIQAYDATKVRAHAEIAAGQFSTLAWRIRINDYRVLYEIHQRILQVIGIDAGHRRDIYR